MVIDIVLCAIVLIFLVLGIWRGFFRSIPKLLRYAIALCLAIFFSATIIDRFTGPYFQALATMKIEEYILASCPDITTDTAATLLPTVLLIISSFFGITIPTDSSATGEEFVHNLSVLIGEPVGTVVAMLITYALLFVIFAIIIKILLKICDSVFSSGFLGVVNKVLGGLVGLSVGCVISCTVANVLARFFPQYAIGCGIPYQFFLNFNPLAFIFSF